MLVFAFRPPIRVPNFSKIEARTHELWRFLQNVRNDEEEKNEEIFTKFCLHISRSLLATIWKYRRFAHDSARPAPTYYQ